MSYLARHPPQYFHLLRTLQAFLHAPLVLLRQLPLGNVPVRTLKTFQSAVGVKNRHAVAFQVTTGSIPVLPA